MSDKTKFLGLVNYLRKQLRELDEELTFADRRRAGLAARRMELDALIVWAETEAVKEIEK